VAVACDAQLLQVSTGQNMSYSVVLRTVSIQMVMKIMHLW
jgi:hypothetical protein